MKNLIIIFLAGLLSLNLQAEKLKPYVLGAVSKLSMVQSKALVKENLEKVGLNVLGSYQPANDPGRYVYAVSSKGLVSAVQQYGGLRAFAAVLRVALTEKDGVINISYTNPYYWGNAYFQDDFPSVASYYNSISNKLVAAMKMSGQYKGTAFGSEKGVDLDDLRDYQYMFGMPEFDDVIVLGKFDSFEQAENRVEANLKKGINGLKEVYSIRIPAKKLKLIGIAISGAKGEAHFVPIIDKSNLKNTAFLPYEILIDGNKVIMLHGRYRIALSFPDLSMGTFSKIMSTPGDIEDQLSKLCQ